MYPPSPPDPAEIAAFRDEQSGANYTYPDVGITARAPIRRGWTPPAGYVCDHNSEPLDHGPERLAAASAEIRRWTMFRVPGVEAHTPDTPIEPGAVVAILVRAMGLWVLNAARIVYVLDEPHQFGFAYGTLEKHAESGEERFLAHMTAGGHVFYDLLAFSRPNYRLPRLAYPYTRARQRAFARGSKAAMRAAVRGSR